MLVKTGIAISDMSGSVGGITAFRNRHGLCLRSRVTPVNPNTDRQQAAKIRMSFLSEAWRETLMDDAKRIAWATYASSVNWKNRLGEATTLTGFNVFCQCNAALLAVGGVVVYDGPEDLGLPAQDPAIVVSCSAATQKLNIVFDDTFEWLDEDGGWMSVHMGLPQSPSRNFFGGPFRYAGSIEGDSVAAPTTPDATIDVPFTAIETQKVWTEIRLIRGDGRCSTRFRPASFIVAA